MTVPTQVKRGYLRGVRGILITKLEVDGSESESESELDPTILKHWVDTSQEVDVSAEIVAGETAELRGGDRLLLRLEDDDIIVGATLTFRDARFDGAAAELIGGGNVIADQNDNIIGWNAPTVEEQAERSPFEAKVYVESFNAAGGREGWLEYTFRYCKGRSAEITHSNRGWGTPEFEVKAKERPHDGASVYQKVFVDSLPELATQSESEQV